MPSGSATEVYPHKKNTTYRHKWCNSRKLSAFRKDVKAKLLAPFRKTYSVSKSQRSHRLLW